MNPQQKGMQRKIDNMYDYFEDLFSQDKDTEDENLSMLHELVDAEIELEKQCNQ